MNLCHYVLTNSQNIRAVADYPVRNRLLTIHMHRRRYMDPDDKNTIPSIFPLKAKGTSISVEFAHFFGEVG